MGGRGGWGFFEERFEAGRTLLRRRAVEQLGRAAPDMLARVERAGGAGLDEPLLWAWMQHQAPPIGLSQILFGYLDEEDRPAQIEVRASRRGVVHLPNLGSLRTGAPSGVFEMRWRGGGEAPSLWAGGRPVEAVFAPRRAVPGTAIELHTDLHPLFPLFFCGAASPEEVDVEETSARCLPALRRAFALLERVSPRLRADIERDCRAVVVLRCEKLNSFASPGIHGAAFLSVCREPTELFFCEDLVHQVGHIAFAGITAGRCFTIPAQTPIALFTVLKDDHRTLDAAFHGNYTMMRMAQLFDACVDDGALPERLRHELIGRFALAMSRFGPGLESIDDERLYTPEAWEMHQRMVEVYEDVAERRGAMLAGCDFSNQSYAFDLARFCALNPPPGRSRSGASRRGWYRRRHAPRVR